MTTGSSVKPDEWEENQQRKERGGSPIDDMSKDFDAGEPDSPFGGSGQDTDAQKDAPDE